MIGLLLTIDIGNTNLTIGAYSGEELKFVSRLATDRSRTEDQYAIELKSIFDLYSYGFGRVYRCAISSVVPELTGAISHAAAHNRQRANCSGSRSQDRNKHSCRRSVAGGRGSCCVSVAAANLYELPCFCY